jgi:hypothetical protein
MPIACCLLPFFVFLPYEKEIDIRIVYLRNYVYVNVLRKKNTWSHSASPRSQLRMRKFANALFFRFGVCLWGRIAYA